MNFQNIHKTNGYTKFLPKREQILRVALYPKVTQQGTKSRIRFAESHRYLRIVVDV